MALSNHRRGTRRPALRRIERRRRLYATALISNAVPSVAEPLPASRLPKIFAAGSLLLLMAALYEFATADIFYAFSLDTQGLGYLTRGQVEDASGIVGYNVFFIESGAVERSLRKLPEVRSAYVWIGMPNQVVVQIEERQPEIVWLRSGEVFWIDAEGMGFKARASRPDLPVVRDLDRSPVKPGQPVTAAAVSAVRAFRDAWPDAPRIFEWSLADGLTFTDEHGWKILLGDAREMDIKVAKLKALISLLIAQKTKVKFIDLGKGEPYFQ